MNLFESILLNEASRGYKKFTVQSEDGRKGIGIYTSKTDMINCIHFMIGRHPTFLEEENLPKTIDEKLYREYPVYASFWGGNSTWNHNIYDFIVLNGLGLPVGDDDSQAFGDYIVKDFDEIAAQIKKKCIPMQMMREKHGDPVGKPVLWDKCFSWKKD